MHVSRRGFLGSILGTYVTTQLPWIAKAAIIQPEPVADGLWRSVLVLADGTKIKGPRFRSCFHAPDGPYEYVFEPLEIVKPLVIRENILVGPTGEPLARTLLAGGDIVVGKGDRFHLTHRIELSFSAKPLAEATQRLPVTPMSRILERNFPKG